MSSTPTAPAWQEAVFHVLKKGNVKQIAYVPTPGTRTLSDGPSVTRTSTTSS